MALLKSRIVHASIDENGNVSGGVVGDQTGKEVCIREWYNKPWNCVLIPTNAELAEKAVNIFCQIASDKNYGYDQSQRTSFYNNIVKNGGNVSGAKGELDCSSGVCGCYKLAGLDISEDLTTSTMKKAFKDAGFIVSTEKRYLTDPTYGVRGMIYLAEGKHTAMCIENGGNQPEKCFLVWKTALKSGNLYLDRALTKVIGSVAKGNGGTINNLDSTSVYTRCKVGTIDCYVQAGTF